METNYLNTDLVIDSQKDLQILIDEFGDNVIVLYHGQFNEMYRAVFELTYDSSVAIEDVFYGFCTLIENLSPQAKSVWDNCINRVLDIGIEAGDSPRPFTLELGSARLRQVSAIGGSLMISVYPITESHQ